MQHTWKLPNLASSPELMVCGGIAELALATSDLNPDSGFVATKTKDVAWTTVSPAFDACMLIRFAVGTDQKLRIEERVQYSEWLEII